MKKNCFDYLLIAFFAVYAFALPARADTVVVVCKSDFQLALVDPATQKVLVKLPTGLGPHEVAISPDGRTAYVSNFGRYSVYPAGDTEHDKAGHTITVIDLVERMVKATFDLGTHTGPHGMIVSHDGKLLWATTETPQAVLEIDSATEKILHIWNTTQERSHMIVATPNEMKFYVTNTVSGSVSIIDRSSGEVKVVKTGPGTEGIAVGGVLGYLIGGYVIRHHASEDQRSAFSITPLIEQSTRTYGLHVEFTPSWRDVTRIGELMGRM